jgi:hypothetical protein
MDYDYYQIFPLFSQLVFFVWLLVLFANFCDRISAAHRQRPGRWFEPRRHAGALLFHPWKTAA